MRRIALALLAIVLVVPAVPAGAQKMRQGLPTWDPGTVRTAKMTVTGLASGRRADIVFLKVKDEAGNHLVMLGPRPALDPALTRIPVSTEIEVTASVVKRGKKERQLFLASVIKVRDKTFRVRDDQGRFLDRSGQPIVPKQ